MKRLPVVLSVMVAVFSILSVSSADTLDETRERLNVEAASVELMALDFELQTLAPKIQAAFAEYKKIGQKIAELSPEKKNLCEELPALNRPALLQGIEEQATRIVEILERARMLASTDVCAWALYFVGVLVALCASFVYY